MFAEDIRQLPPVGFFPKDFDFLYRRLFKTHWKCSLHSGSFYFLRKYCLLFKFFERKWSCSIDVVGKMKWTLEALKGNRTVNWHAGKKITGFFLLFKFYLSGEIWCKYRSRTFVFFVLGILFVWTNGIKIPFNFVFHLIGLFSSVPARHYGSTSHSSGTSMFDFFFFSLENPVESLNERFLDCGKARCSSHVAFPTGFKTHPISFFL